LRGKCKREKGKSWAHFACVASHPYEKWRGKKRILFGIRITPHYIESVTLRRARCGLCERAKNKKQKKKKQTKDLQAVFPRL
jgi:hypothetical protein